MAEAKLDKSLYIGRAALLTTSTPNGKSDGPTLPVTVTDARAWFGRIDLEVEPVAPATGKVWVNEDRLTFLDALGRRIGRR